jgi:DNA-binding transcriptional LysR family regulator
MEKTRVQPSRADLADFTYFLAIARHRNFRRAGLELGVSPSAVSHALKGLEARIGVRLINRTNRSVTLTAAGEALQAVISAPFEAIGEAMETINRYRDAPVGRVRLNVPEDAALHLLGPVLPAFVDRYPDVELDLSVTNRLVDMTDGGFDAGIRFGGTVPEDMVTQRLSADIRWVVVGSPGYLERFGTPMHPDDLASHRCIKIRLGDERIYRWEFERDGEEFAVVTPGAITIDHTQLAKTLALGGAGLMYAPEPTVAEQVAAGTLVHVLDDWLSVGPAYHIYYSSRRQVPEGLKLLIALIRELRPLGL